ncbi:MAG: ABC transporter transmembrane domain-containing protein, partial [Betaproteobacteria bacterium]
ERYESERAGTKLQTVFRLNMKSAAIEGAMGAVAGAGFALVLVGVVWYGARRVLSGSLTSADLIAFFMTIMIISGPSQACCRASRSFAQGESVIALRCR